MKNLFINICISLLGVFMLKAQVGIGTNNPNKSAALDMKSENKGLLLPRVNPSDINNPAEGLLIYNSVEKCISVYNNRKWRCLLVVNTLVNIPDGNFKSYLKKVIPNAFPSGGGDKMDSNHKEVKSLTTIKVSDLSISSLEGIEYFTGLTKLYCDENNLNALDISQNTALTMLSCSNNKLKALDVTKNMALTYLALSLNRINSLDVTKKTDLTYLNCYNNQLKGLDVTQNTALTELNCSTNGLTSLDVTQNTALTELNCSTNGLTSLDVSQNTALIILYCYKNNLKGELDLSHNCKIINLSYINPQKKVLLLQ